MLTDEETDAVCREWHAKSESAKAATIRRAERLRAMAQAGPRFNSEQLETWRLGSQKLSREISEEWEQCWVGAAPAIEVGILEKLFTSPKIKAWEGAYRVIQAGLSDPHIAADSEMCALFRNFLEGISETADLGMTHYLVMGYLVTPEVEKDMISMAGRRHGKKPHINHEQATQRLPRLWADMKKKGKSKTQAAPLIADMLGLSVATVRKKLQGL